MLGHPSSELDGKSIDTLHGFNSGLLGQCNLLDSLFRLQELLDGSTLPFIGGVDGPEDGGAHTSVSTAELNDLVNAARTDQGLVQLLKMVGCHDENTAFLRGNAVENVEETRQGEAAGECGGCRRSTRLARCDCSRHHSLLITFTLGFITGMSKTCGVDIFKEYNAAAG
ncbi:hypothetical protein HG530_009810 [Fusarium avenaceum]|nr:hypothetical protein HG530_009810 [Fusarium avenaceum]